MNDLTVVDRYLPGCTAKGGCTAFVFFRVFAERHSRFPWGLSFGGCRAFCRDAETVGTSVNFLIREGILVARAAPEIKLHEAAEGGNVEAIKQLEAVRKRHTFERLIEQMDDDEFN